MQAVVVTICSVEILSSPNDIRNKISEIISAICALLNSNGGKVELHTVSHKRVIKRQSSAAKSSMIRKIEQTMISLIGIYQTVSNINFKEDKESIVILVKKADSLITTNYNLYLPSQTQVVQVPATEPPEKISNIINRKVISQEIVLGCHQKTFLKDKNCGFDQSKMVQIKCLKSDSSKRTTLPDRITGKGNKFSCYISAFSNSNGGHIYYGIADDGVVQGQIIPGEEEKKDITKKVEKAINKMIWPEQIGQPKRGEHWEIFFEPVLDENSNAVPSTFVIVIYIAACLGGVFTDEPECYEMVEGEVKKMSLATWREKILPPVWLQSKEEIPHPVGRITWSSVENRKAYTFADQTLMQLLNNGNWNAISKNGICLENKYPGLTQIKLLVLSKRITARYRRGHIHEAQTLLHEFESILPQAQDLLIFEVLQLYLNAALKRASGDFVGLKEFLFAALSKTEFIEPGLVPAIVYIFSATVTDLLNSEDQTETFSPQHLSIKALQHLECVPDSSNVLPDMKQKSHMTLATFFLGCNISGQRIKSHEDVHLDEAKKSIMAVHESIYEGNSPSRYREVQLYLVQSIYYYRYSQNVPDRRARYLSDAFNYAKKAESLARDYQFMEMVEWSKTNQALCTEELLRTRLFFSETSHPSKELTLRYTNGASYNTTAKSEKKSTSVKTSCPLYRDTTVTPETANGTIMQN